MSRMLPGEWYMNILKRRFEWYPFTEVEDGSERQPTLSVPYEEAQKLVEYMTENGHVKPRLFDQEIRKEDLNLMNRLIDVMEQKIPGGNK